MIRLVLIFTLLIASLNALSDSDVLKQANTLMESNNKSDKFRAYNDYKSLYLRAIISEDDNLRLNSLKGIVRSGESLNIDVSKYSKELSQIESKTTHKISKDKPKLKSNTSLKSTTSKKKKEKTVKEKSSLNKVKSINFKNEKLVLEFDKKIVSKDINYFTMHNAKKRKYKYIFDAHALVLKAKKLNKKGIKRIVIAQYKPKIMRLVIEDDEKVKIKFYVRDKQLIIEINDSGKKTSAIKNKDTKPEIKAKDKVIVIDPGHGGRDPGALGYKRYREKIVVMQISEYLKSILKSRGYKVYMTRDKDKFVKLKKRTQYANKKNADIFISVHANAVGRKNAEKVHGVECYFLSKSRSSRAKKVAAKENSADLSDMNFYGKESFLNTLSSHNIVASNKLAIDLQRGMLGSLKKDYKDVYDGGVREGPFWVLVGAQMPSVLVEVGFISHPTEAKRLVSSKYQKKLAYGVADGIERYFENNN